MKGHLRERSPGRWAIVIDTRDQNGKRKRKWYSFAGNKRGAQIECANRIAELTKGTALDPSKVTLREFMERWLTHIATQVSPRSAENYREVADYWILPALGNAKLAKLQAEQIAQAYADALTRGGRKGAGISPRSVVMMHRTLSQSLKQAVIWKLLSTNPAAYCKPPRVERKEMKVLDPGATATLIESARDSRLHIPTLLFVGAGMRRGELAAVRWSRVDFATGKIAISTNIEQTKAGTREKPPKNGRARSITLPGFVVEELRHHKAKQAEQLLRLGVRQTGDTHVCLLEDGSPWRPRALTYAMARLIRRSGVPRIKPCHGLRHGHATHLLTSNVHPKVVQERLGHASIQLTMDTYSHVMPTIDEAAAATIDNAMRATLKKQIR